MDTINVDKYLIEDKLYQMINYLKKNEIDHGSFS